MPQHLRAKTASGCGTGVKARHCVERVLRCLLGLYLIAGLLALIVALARFLRACLRHKRPPRPEHTGEPADSGYVPEHAIRQADPLIYSQEWLIQHGLAVTWQNPDFRLEKTSALGVGVSAWDLEPDTDYRIMINVWNGATTAPAVDVGVTVSYLDFGIGGVSVPVATTEVDVPVKGAVGLPAVASVPWHTPATPGHYCLQARLLWPYDAEPGNNMGQHNVNVQPFNSPTARFTVPMRNTGRAPITLRLVVDGYELPPLEPCPPKGREPADRRRKARLDHSPEAHALGDDWQVDFDDVVNNELQLAPGDGRDIEVTVTALDGFVGRRAINVQGWDGHRLVGGVTLVGEGAT